MAFLRNLYTRDRNGVLLVAAILLTGLIAARPLYFLFDTAVEREQNSHIILVLPIVVSLIVLESRGRRPKPQPSPYLGAMVLAASLALMVLGVAYGGPLGHSNALSLSILGLVLAWLGCVIVFYGLPIFRDFAFPLLFLFLLVPLPDFLLNRVTYFLQVWSTHATHALFVAAGVPVAREGFVLFLPHIDIEVAAECSGIRSTMMLVLTTLVLGHLFLRSAWRQGVLFVAVIVIAVLKNALRIFTLSMLAMYVDPSWIEGDFHHRYGGSVFFVLALAMILGMLHWLRRGERKRLAGETMTTVDARGSNAT